MQTAKPGSRGEEVAKAEPQNCLVGWQLDVQRGPQWLLVKLRRSGGSRVGETGDEATALFDRIWSLLENHFTYRVVLDFEQLDLLNSPLIGQLIRLSKRIQERDGVIRLCGLSDHNRHVLHTCHLSDRLRPYHTRREAVMARM